MKAKHLITFYCKQNYKPPFYEAFERRSLRATASVQSSLGVPVIIHPGRHHESPAEIVRILQEAGGDISRTVMSHLDRRLHLNLVPILTLRNTNMYLLSFICNSIDNSNPASWKTTICWFLTLNFMASDVMATQEVRTSATKVLIYFYRKIAISAPERSMF